ncbi:MAG: hypothetical protein L0Y60_17430 [Beijerinckiaceae bacterium]|nr:hypothetical protein [Beijerinckiaceae bacterium]
MAVLAPALHKLTPIRCAGLRPIQLPALSFPGRSIALQIAQKGVGSIAAALQSDDARIDHDAAHPLARAVLPGQTLQPVGRRLPTADP